MIQDTDNRPLVTFAVFAYNHENYIRQAVAGALSQTYEPLEIILSDDCSTDSTFEIMQEMAASYTGPHRVRVVQTPVNLGVLAHDLLRGKEASGEIVVMAAGDDISLPERTAQIVGAFDNDTACVFSLFSIIDENGLVIAPLAERPLHNQSDPQIYLRNRGDKYETIQGCSQAFKKWVFDIPIPAKSVMRDYPEDLLFTFYLRVIGAGIRRIESPLIKYRTHSGAMSNCSTRRSASAEEQFVRRLALGRLQMLDEFHQIASASGKLDLIDNALFEDTRASAAEIIDWRNLSFIGRVERVLRASRTANRDELRGKYPNKWRLARLWGQYPYYQPKLFLSSLRKRHR